MVQSVWRQGVACVLGVGLSACATVPVGSKSYVAKASVQGGQKGDGKVDTDLLALEYKDSGVLSPGGKIAVLPMYPCDTKVNHQCYAEIDKLEHALGEAGFWVEHWRDLLAGTEEENLARVKERGIVHALEVQEYHLVSGSKGYAQLKDITLLEQDEAKKPRDLELSPKEWKVVGPRCVKYFEKGLLGKTSAARAEMAVRLISVPEQRVLWTHRVARWGDDRVNDIQVFHDVPKQVKNKKSQRYWGLGMAVTGVGLGIGAAAGAKKMSTPATLVMAGVGLISAGIGGWLIYDSRPREVHELGPADVLCETKYVGAQSSGAKLTSSRFQVASSGGGSSMGVQEAAIENSVVFNVVDKVKGLERETYQKPKDKDKDKKKEKKKDKKKTTDSDVLSALACRWEDKELRCKAACTLCEDPWEGPCEICRPRRLSKRKSLDPNSISYEEFQRIQAVKSMLEARKAQADEPSDHDPAAKKGKKKKAKKKKAKADKKGQDKASKADAEGKASKGGEQDKASKGDAQAKTSDSADKGEADAKGSETSRKESASESSEKSDAQDKKDQGAANVKDNAKPSDKTSEKASKADAKDKSSKSDADKESGEKAKSGGSSDADKPKQDQKAKDSSKKDKADAKPAKKGEKKKSKSRKKKKSKSASE